MLPVELFDFEGLTHPLILDMAASPGGKTTHLIDRSLDEGLVLANDSSQERITALRLVLQNWGAFHQAVTCFPGEKFGLWFPERFDRVLLDAPCSMQNLRSSEARPVRAISDKERDSLAMRQKRLLSSAFQAVKPGGQVVYSTCTLNPEENEAVLDDLLKRYPDAARVVDVQQRLPAPAPALESFDGELFDATVRGAARLWPHRFGTSGFFAALIEKVSTLGLSAQSHPETSLDKAGFLPLTISDLQSIVHQFNDLYGFDLQEKVLSRGVVFWQRGESVFAFSERWLRQFSSLPTRSAGMLVLERVDTHIAVSHEFAARFGSEFQNGIYVLPDECQAAWLRGEDLQGGTFPEKQRGCVWVMMDGVGRLMGRGKVTARGIKNLLPRRVIYT